MCLVRGVFHGRALLASGQKRCKRKGSESTTQPAGALCSARYTIAMGSFRALNYAFVNAGKQ